MVFSFIECWYVLWLADLLVFYESKVMLERCVQLRGHCYRVMLERCAAEGALLQGYVREMCAAERSLLQGDV